jgi:hypothetical protein
LVKRMIEAVSLNRLESGMRNYSEVRGVRDQASGIAIGLGI